MVLVLYATLASLMIGVPIGIVAARLKDAGVAVMVVHGEADDVVPVQGSRDLAAQMQNMGIDSFYIELPGVGHGPVINLAQEYIFDFFDQHAK
jgi:pimeloyl-ACP methyl ester carboxylesterase